MNDIIKEELERLVDTIAVSAFQNLYVNYDEEKLNGGARIITTTEVDRLEDLPILLGDTLYYDGNCTESFIAYVKAHINFVEENSGERVLGIYSWWCEKETWFFGINIFDAGFSGYTWKNESDISKWNPKDTFIVKEDWYEKVYYN